MGRRELRHRPEIHGDTELNASSNDLIFVSVAAYRDPQLLPTLTHCLSKAVKPELLRFGVCWQHDPSEPEPALFRDKRFRILDVDWRDSRGACWARAEVMKLWDGEDWFLQVDSHCRFADGWDEMLRRMMGETGSEKPILSTYASPFTPSENEILQQDPFQMVFQAFTQDGLLQLMPGKLPRQASFSPRRARFLAAGFLFAEGRFVEEVPYDPELYFMGEESAMTVRAYTHGYDLFHPAQTVIWHDYVRADSRKHWSDHTEENSARKPWNQLDETSRKKVQRLLLGEPVEDFGLGTVRTLSQYESYAGLNFRLKKAQLETIRAAEPPNNQPDPGWTERIYPWITMVKIKRALLPPGSLEDPVLWSLSVMDEEGFEICRRDLTTDELKPLVGEQEDVVVVCEFPSETIPSRWTVWPMSRSRGWLSKVAGKFEESDFAILLDESEVGEPQNKAKTTDSDHA